MRAVGIVVVVALLGVGVWVLRAQTMTVHQEVAEDSSLDVRVFAATREQSDPAAVLTRAHVEACTAESVPHSRVVTFGPAAPDAADDRDSRHGFRFTIEPGADPPDRAQLHGCLEDLRIRHLRLEVTGMVMRVGEDIIERRET